ncbi:MAG: MoaD/ThiS family protein [Anaerolineae bacterium]
MVHVKFTSHLYKFFPGLTELQIDAHTVAEVVTAIDQQFPGLADYVVDETGALRKHVNIFVGDTMVEDRQRLQDSLKAGDRVFIMQALSGG